MHSWGTPHVRQGPRPGLLSGTEAGGWIGPASKQGLYPVNVNVTSAAPLLGASLFRFSFFFFLFFFLFFSPLLLSSVVGFLFHVDIPILGASFS